jgi:hypothetical protein
MNLRMHDGPQREGNPSLKRIKTSDDWMTSSQRSKRRAARALSDKGSGGEEVLSQQTRMAQRPRRGHGIARWLLALLVLIASTMLVCASGGLVAEESAAMHGARSANTLEKREGMESKSVSTQDKQEMNRLEKKLEVRNSNNDGGNLLSRADREADAKENKLVSSAERAEKAAEHEEEKAEKALEASGAAQGGQEEEHQTKAALEAAIKAEDAENRAASEEDRIARSTEREMHTEEEEEKAVKDASEAVDKVQDYRTKASRDDDQAELAKGVEKKALADANREQAEGSEEAASNERLAVDMAARVEAKKRESDKALLKEAEATVKAEDDLNRIDSLERSDGEGQDKAAHGKDESNEADEDNGMGPMDRGRSRERGRAAAGAGKTQGRKSGDETKEEARCVGECMKDCQEDCDDPDMADEDKLVPDKDKCGAQCDKDCFEQCAEDGAMVEQDTGEEGKEEPYAKEEEEDDMEQSVPKWNELDDEDPDEPASGSGKGVQKPSPVFKREMDLECLNECTPRCDGECEEDQRDEHEAKSPSMAQGPKECRHVLDPKPKTPNLAPAALSPRPLTLVPLSAEPLILGLRAGRFCRVGLRAGRFCG